jgi:hypothetical protein
MKAPPQIDSESWAAVWQSDRVEEGEFKLAQTRRIIR